MILSRLRPAVLNFLAGVCIAASVNLVTSLATSSAQRACPSPVALPASQAPLSATPRPLSGNGQRSEPAAEDELARESSCLIQRTLVSSLPWAVTALFLALLAADLDDARREADLLATPSLSVDEVRELILARIRARRARTTALLVLSILSGLVSVGLTVSIYG